MAELTHLDEHGAAHIVDVGGKAVTTREATAAGRITLSPEALQAIRDGSTKKGDVLAVARVAGIMAAKRTSDLIPLCHPLPLTRVSLDLTLGESEITATATCATDGKTGVEMEALTAVSVALLTVYDMAKALDRGMTIEGVRLLAKRGGKSGEWVATEFSLSKLPVRSVERNRAESEPTAMTVNKLVSDRDGLDRLIRSTGGGPYYVYVLCKPDGQRQHGYPGTPFYVGIGQNTRLFAHEEEAHNAAIENEKVNAIREIWTSGGEVLRVLDSVHLAEPWGREEELINQIGCLANDRGPLTNAQSYSPSVVSDGVELRKYAAEVAVRADPNTIPARFKLRDARLMAGPRAPSSAKSVFGKLYSVAQRHPGITGTELIALLMGADFSENKSAYTQGGKVSAAWLAGYIEGAYFRQDRQHLQDYRP